MLEGVDYLPSLDETALYLRENPKMDDLLYVGGSLNPRAVIGGYAKGLFPMFIGRDEDETIGWFSPQQRVGLDLTPFHGVSSKIRVHRSLEHSMRRFILRVNTNFRAVLEACASSREVGNWIESRFIEVYCELHNAGLAHSFEIYLAQEPDRLVGGLFGVSVGGLFSGESMFHFVSDASKAAFVGSVAILHQAGYHWIDGQWLTEHLLSLGMQETRRKDYLAKLPSLLKVQPSPLPTGEVIRSHADWLEIVTH
ncbi:MAG: leucyl/phenylalanyl-tRNA--protein transferase [Acidimicrobiales bacterium]